VHTTKVRHHTCFALCTCSVCLPRNRMMMCQHSPTTLVTVLCQWHVHCGSGSATVDLPIECWCSCAVPKHTIYAYYSCWSSCTGFQGALPLPANWHVSNLPTCWACFILYVCRLGPCPVSCLVCDLLARQLCLRSVKGTLPEEYLSHNLDEHCLRDTRPVVPYQP